MKISHLKQAFVFSVITLGLLAIQSAQAQVLFTGSYTQNFSSMGSGTTLPTGWSGVSESGSHNTFAPNVANYDNGGVTGVNPNFTAGTLSASTVEYLAPTQGSSTGKGTDVVNYVNILATAGNGEGSESLGTDPSGNAATILELTLTNNTGSAITALNLSYDIDRFTTVSNTNNITSGYVNTGVEEFPGYQLFYNLTPSNAATWVNVSSLNPTILMGTVAGAVNVPNTVGITTVPTTTVTLGGSVAAGGTFAVAWLDDNGYSPSPDQEIGLNNVAISTVVAPEPSSLALCVAGALMLAVVVLRRRQS